MSGRDGPKRPVWLERVILPDDLHVRTAPRPDPDAREIAISPRAIGVNLDVPAWELSGVVTRAGGGFQIGDPVMGVTDHSSGPFLGVVDHGAAALDDVVAPVDRFVKLPAGWSFEQGAAFPVDYLHAFELLSVRGRAGAGTRVLVPGAGALREAVRQIGRALGCDLVEIGERSVDLDAGGELEELFADPARMRRRFEQILALAGVSPLVGALFPFDQVREALAYLESGRSAGKVVLTLDDP